MRIQFIEPPKQFWFVMGEYLPPPLGILCLAAYLEANHDGVEIDVVDCQAARLGWEELENRIKTFKPDVVAPSSVSTGNAYLAMRTVEFAKKLDPSIVTLAGGQHFSALAKESLERYPELDIVVRGEGEVTLAELIKVLDHQQPLSTVKGISFRKDGKIIETPPRPVIKDLDMLPYPGYHFVREHMKKYHFTMMAGKDTPYALIEASRGCNHQCTFCSQWPFWGACRRKSPKRVADEFEYVFREFGSRFLWLTDDNLGLDRWMDLFCQELKKRGLTEDLLWFLQVRADDIIAGKEILPLMREAGCYWIMAGLESHDPATLQRYQKGLEPSMGKVAMDLLKKHGILAQATAIIGDRLDTHEQIEEFRRWIKHVDPDIAIFMTLTPFPGSTLYKMAQEQGWIEDTNWAHYDMIHAIMPTEFLSRSEVQRELFLCYKSFYGSWKKRITGLFSRNRVKRTYFRYMFRQGLLHTLRGLF